jgi:hypothetical protein
MKTFKIFIALLVSGITVFAQDKLPVIKSNSNPVSIRDGKLLKKNGWNLSPQARPDIYEAQLIDGKPHTVTFITDVDSIAFTVEAGKKYDFIIQWNDKLCYVQIVGVRFVPAAVFDKKYQAKHRGKISVEIPEVYELVNIAIALTRLGIEDKFLVYKKTGYYNTMREWFDKYKDHSLLDTLDIELRKDAFLYFKLKMNGYSFEFNKKNEIIQSKIYNRTGFAGAETNYLQPYLTLLQSFSDKTNFRRFFKENRDLYRQQIAFYRDTANIPEMKKWLDKNFPGASDYGTYKIIFSPLIGLNQSATWLESNGFKELHAHINYPYQSNKSYPPDVDALVRGDIAFGEINHGYINPESEKYADRISRATSNRSRWADDTKSAKSYLGIGLFNEYMNWVLNSLRYIDYVPNEQQKPLIDLVSVYMRQRGFIQFDSFNIFMVDLYRTKKPNQTISSLYPQIIDWFEKTN